MPPAKPSPSGAPARRDRASDRDDAALFFLYELYDDEAAIRAHLQSPHFLQMNAATASWVDAKVVLNLHRTQP